MLLPPPPKGGGGPAFKRRRGANSVVPPSNSASITSSATPSIDNVCTGTHIFENGLNNSHEEKQEKLNLDLCTNKVDVSDKTISDSSNCLKSEKTVNEGVLFDLEEEQHIKSSSDNLINNVIYDALSTHMTPSSIDTEAIQRREEENSQTKLSINAEGASSNSNSEEDHERSQSDNNDFKNCTAPDEDTHSLATPFNGSRKDKLSPQSSNVLDTWCQPRGSDMSESIQSSADAVKVSNQNQQSEYESTKEIEANDQADISEYEEFATFTMTNSIAYKSNTELSSKINSEVSRDHSISSVEYKEVGGPISTPELKTNETFLETTSEVLLTTRQNCSLDNECTVKEDSEDISGIPAVIEPMENVDNSFKNNGAVSEIDSEGLISNEGSNKVISDSFVVEGFKVDSFGEVLGKGVINPRVYEQISASVNEIPVRGTENRVSEKDFSLESNSISTDLDSNIFSESSSNRDSAKNPDLLSQYTGNEVTPESTVETGEVFESSLRNENLIDILNGPVAAISESHGLKNSQSLAQSEITETNSSEGRVSLDIGMKEEENGESILNNWQPAQYGNQGEKAPYENQSGLVDLSTINKSEQSGPDLSRSLVNDIETADSIGGEMDKACSSSESIGDNLPKNNVLLGQSNSSENERVSLNSIESDEKESSTDAYIERITVDYSSEVKEDPCEHIHTCITITNNTGEDCESSTKDKAYAEDKLVRQITESDYKELICPENFKVTESLDKVDSSNNSILISHDKSYFQSLNSENSEIYECTQAMDSTGGQEIPMRNWDNNGMNISLMTQDEISQFRNSMSSSCEYIPEIGLPNEESNSVGSESGSLVNKEISESEKLVFKTSSKRTSDFSESEKFSNMEYCNNMLEAVNINIISETSEYREIDLSSNHDTSVNNDCVLDQSTDYYQNELDIKSNDKLVESNIPLSLIDRQNEYGIDLKPSIVFDKIVQNQDKVDIPEVLEPLHMPIVVLSSDSDLDNAVSTKSSKILKPGYDHNEQRQSLCSSPWNQRDFQSSTNQRYLRKSGLNFSKDSPSNEIDENMKTYLNKSCPVNYHSSFKGESELPRYNKGQSIISEYNGTSSENDKRTRRSVSPYGKSMIVDKNPSNINIEYSMNHEINTFENATTSRAVKDCTVDHSMKSDYEDVNKKRNLDDEKSNFIIDCESVVSGFDFAKPYAQNRHILRKESESQKLSRNGYMNEEYKDVDQNKNCKKGQVNNIHYDQDSTSRYCITEIGDCVFSAEHIEHDLTTRNSDYLNSSLNVLGSVKIYDRDLNPTLEESGDFFQSTDLLTVGGLLLDNMVPHQNLEEVDQIVEKADFSIDIEEILTISKGIENDTTNNSTKDLSNSELFLSRSHNVEAADKVDEGINMLQSVNRVESIISAKGFMTDSAQEVSQMAEFNSSLIDSVLPSTETDTISKLATIENSHQIYLDIPSGFMKTSNITTSQSAPLYSSSKILEDSYNRSPDSCAMQYKYCEEKLESCVENKTEMITQRITKNNFDMNEDHYMSSKELVILKDLVNTKVQAIFDIPNESHSSKNNDMEGNAFFNMADIPQKSFKNDTTRYSKNNIVLCGSNSGFETEVKNHMSEALAEATMKISVCMAESIDSLSEQIGTFMTEVRNQMNGIDTKLGVLNRNQIRTESNISKILDIVEKSYLSKQDQRSEIFDQLIQANTSLVRENLTLLDRLEKIEESIANNEAKSAVPIVDDESSRFSCNSHQTNTYSATITKKLKSQPIDNISDDINCLSSPNVDNRSIHLKNEGISSPLVVIETNVDTNFNIPEFTEYSHTDSKKLDSQEKKKISEAVSKTNIDLESSNSKLSNTGCEISVIALTESSSETCATSIADSTKKTSGTENDSSFDMVDCEITNDKDTFSPDSGDKKQNHSKNERSRSSSRTDPTEDVGFDQLLKGKTNFLQVRSFILNSKHHQSLIIDLDWLESLKVLVRFISKGTANCSWPSDRISFRIIRAVAKYTISPKFSREASLVARDLRLKLRRMHRMARLFSDYCVKYPDIFEQIENYETSNEAKLALFCVSQYLKYMNLSRETALVLTKILQGVPIPFKVEYVHKTWSQWRINPPIKLDKEDTRTNSSIIQEAQALFDFTEHKFNDDIVLSPRVLSYPNQSAKPRFPNLAGAFSRAKNYLRTEFFEEDLGR